jgi:CBS domain-containing protein
VKVESILRDKGHQVSTIQPWASVREALTRLVGPPAIGALVVTGVPRGLSGMISERDLVRELRRHGPGLLDLRVSDLMTHHVPTCAPGDSINKAMMLMTRSRYRHLPVLDDGELVGLISIGDVVRARLAEMELETRVLRDMNLARH